MPIKLQYKAKIENGTIRMGKNTRKRMSNEVAKAFPGKNVTITVEKQRNARTLSQNAYYWSVVIPCILSAFIELGNDLQVGNSEHRELVHQILKERLLNNGLEIADANGELIKMPASTRACSVSEFMDYLSRVERWANEHLNIMIPAPGEQTVIFN